jgi:hypothetical protein
VNPAADRELESAKANPADRELESAWFQSSSRLKCDIMVFQAFCFNKQTQLVALCDITVSSLCFNTQTRNLYRYSKAASGLGFGNLSEDLLSAKLAQMNEAKKNGAEKQPSAEDGVLLATTTDAEEKEGEGDDAAGAKYATVYGGGVQVESS